MSKELAIQKLEKELRELKTRSFRVDAMKKAVHDALAEFCRQDEEFAQAILQGGSFADCMKAVSAGVGSSISDLDAYRRAVQFYFPGANIRFRMEINLCAGAEDGPEPAPERTDKPKVLSLFDLM